MQYQIINKEGTIIAWISTREESDSIAVHEDYDVIMGDDLDYVEIEGDMKPVLKMII